MCRFIETLRIEKGKICNVQFHNQRLNKTLVENNIDLSEPVRLENIIRADKYQKRTKCHIDYGRTIEKITCSEYHPRMVRSLRLVEANELDYRFKYADRGSLDALFERKGDADDVLIVKNNRLTDTTIANIALFDGVRWVTPAHPLLEGTCRKRLLNEGILSVKDIFAEDIFSYRYICTLNAMLDFREMEFEITPSTILLP